jgi:hypothetical protein
MLVSFCLNKDFSFFSISSFIPAFLARLGQTSQFPELEGIRLIPENTDSF